MIDLAKREGGIDQETLETAVIMLSPFAPHVAEELWEQLGHTDSVFHQENGWPQYDQEMMKDDEVEIPVQVNGKIRCVISLPANVSKEEALKAGEEAVASRITGKIVKEIFVPGKIINFVVK